MKRIAPAMAWASNLSPSIQSNSRARLIADGTRLVVGLLTASITARTLGPADKGTLSALLFASVLLTYGSSLGLGDAAVVMRGRGVASLQRALSASILPVLATSIVGISALWAAALLGDWSSIYPSVAVASLGIPIATFGYLFTGFQSSLENLVVTSAVSVLRLVLEAAAVLLLIVFLSMGILGGALASLVGSLVACLLLGWSLRASGLSLRPTLDLPYLQKALRFGIVNETAYVLVALSQRFDLLLVYSLVDEKEAGYYAIALTVSGIVSYAPAALTSAVFPRIANVPSSEADVLVARLARLTIAIGTIGAIGGLLVLPRAIPALFGSEFRAAVGPSMLLVANSVFSSLELSLTRAAAARGDSRIYMAAFGTNLLVMGVADLLLVPRLGAFGAAIGAMTSTLVGLSVCLWWYARRIGVSSFKGFIPAPADFRDLADFVKSTMGRP